MPWAAGGPPSSSASASVSVSVKASSIHLQRLAGLLPEVSRRYRLGGVESQFRHLMRVAVSVREGAISSSTLLKRLRSGSRKNATYTAFREVGRVIRTVQLLHHLSDAPLRRRVTAATNKVESFNRFSQWIGFRQPRRHRRQRPHRAGEGDEVQRPAHERGALPQCPGHRGDRPSATGGRVGRSPRRTWPTSRRT
ncbi:Tn3 family transposase [Streptomyces sp. SID5464]|nr:Tn3 family transposase [Streptomyces sp. SID5464]